MANHGKFCKLWKVWWTDSRSFHFPKTFHNKYFPQVASSAAVIRVLTFGTEGWGIRIPPGVLNLRDFSSRLCAVCVLGCLAQQFPYLASIPLVFVRR